MPKLLTPNSETIELTQLIDLLIFELLTDISKKEISNESEIQITTYNLLQRLIRDIQAILTLAQSNLLLLPSAVVISRSVIEISCKILWILKSNSEKGQIFHLFQFLSKDEAEDKKYIEKLKALKISENEFKPDVEARSELINKIKQELTKKYPELGNQDKQMPDTWELLKQLSKKDKNYQKAYSFYQISSQYIHGAFSSTFLYRRCFPSGEIGERIDDKEWFDPLFICYYMLSNVGRRFLEVFNYTQIEFPSQKLIDNIEQRLNIIKPKNLDI